MAVLAIGDVVGAIEARISATGVPVVAIDGPSGSGKSTLAGRLSENIPGSVIVEVDDFNSWADPVGERWWARLESQVLRPAEVHGLIRYQRRDWSHDEFGEALGEWRTVPPDYSVVILEGVTAARSSVRERGAFTIWVEAPADRRLARGLERDGDTHRELWRTWMQAEEMFFANDNTRTEVDLRIDGDPSGPHDRLRQVVLL